MMPSLSRSAKRAERLMLHMDKRYRASEERHHSRIHDAKDPLSALSQPESLRLASEQELEEEFGSLLSSFGTTFLSNQEHREKAFKEVQANQVDIMRSLESRHDQLFQSAQNSRNESFTRTWDRLLQDTDSFTRARNDYFKVGHEARAAALDDVETRITQAYEQLMMLVKKCQLWQTERGMFAKEWIRYHPNAWLPPAEDGDGHANHRSDKGKQREVRDAGPSQTYHGLEYYTQLNPPLSTFEQQTNSYPTQQAPYLQQYDDSYPLYAEHITTSPDVIRPTGVGQTQPHLGLSPSNDPTGPADPPKDFVLYEAHPQGHSLLPTPPNVHVSSDEVAIAHIPNARAYLRHGSTSSRTTSYGEVQGPAHGAAGSGIAPASYSDSARPISPTMIGHSEETYELPFKSVREQLSAFHHDFSLKQAERDDLSGIIQGLSDFLTAREQASRSAQLQRDTAFYKQQSKFDRQLRELMILQRSHCKHLENMQTIAATFRDDTFAVSAVNYDRTVNRAMFRMSNEATRTQVFEDEWVRKKKQGVEGRIKKYRMLFDTAREDLAKEFKATAQMVWPYGDFRVPPGGWTSFHSGGEWDEGVVEKRRGHYEPYMHPGVQTLDLNDIENTASSTRSSSRVSSVSQAPGSTNDTHRSATVHLAEPKRIEACEGVSLAKSFTVRLVFLRDQLKRKVTANVSLRKREASIKDMQSRYRTALLKLRDRNRPEFDNNQVKRKGIAQTAESDRQDRFSSALALSAHEMIDLQHSAESNFHERERDRSLNFLQAQQTRESEFLAAMKKLEDKCFRAERERQAEFELWVRGMLRGVLKEIDKQRAELIRLEEQRDDWVAGVLRRRPHFCSNPEAEALTALEIRWWSRFERSFLVQ